jgi:hypothetical protein
MKFPDTFRKEMNWIPFEKVLKIILKPKNIKYIICNNDEPGQAGKA